MSRQIVANPASESNPLTVSHWECEKGDKFLFGEDRSPHKCPKCGSVMIKYVA